ncbi:MAG: hypothetical protein GF335_03845, partial [Candidatus Moranbacteria bacterium]|nr:hypothetical protein [Candidatus Moranbacteria bacterium]
KIIAMAESPSYNNNEFNKVEDPAIFKNNCISSQYEPGSVFKPITASIPLDLDVVNPDSTYIDKGYYKVSGFTIHNSDEKSYGKTSFTQFLELSLNTGAIWAMQLAGQENFHQYLQNYGFGEKTGIELSAETKGDISNLDFNREVNYVTASFGQGISVTPIQLVSAFSAIVNDGNLMKPQIVEKFIYSDQKEEIVEPQVVRRVIRPDTSQKMRAILISVVKNGWGKKAQVPGYLIGGKTGTAQVPNKEEEGYSDDTIHSFVSFAMTDQVEFVTLVKLDNVSQVRFASDSSALITGKLNRFLLDHYNIFPTEEIDEEELKKFNELMELKQDDIKRIEQENQQGAEGMSSLES